MSFSHQENIKHDSLLISKNVFDFNKHHFTTNLRDEQCLVVKPLSKHIEDTPLGPLDRPCSPSQRSDQNFKMAEMKRIAVERFMVDSSKET